MEDGRYHFHATLAAGLPPDEFARAQAALEGTPVGFRFIFDTLGLFCGLGPEESIVYRRAPVRA